MHSTLSTITTHKMEHQNTNALSRTIPDMEVGASTDFDIWLSSQISWKSMFLIALIMLVLLAFAVLGTCLVIKLMVCASVLSRNSQIPLITLTSHQ